MISPIHRMKDIVKQTFPGVCQSVWKAREEKQMRQREANIARVTPVFTREHGLQVMGGPFQGMRYVNAAVGSALLPKLVGSYEAELHSILQSLPDDLYELVIDVGCAEGYYAVGLARKWPRAQVLAYDIDTHGQALCARMAGENGVAERVQVRGECDENTLRVLAGKRALLVSDCEGFELELLDPEQSPELRDCDILVEMHDFLGRPVCPVICERFADTHVITLIDTAPRNPADYPCLMFLPTSDQLVALDEMRPAMQWAFLQSKQALSAGMTQ